MNIKKIAILLLAVATGVSANAKLSVKEPCSDRMVLQQQSEAPVWGHATPGASIKVKTGWDSATYKAVADEKGIWKVSVKTPGASYRQYDIKVSGEGESYVIKDVLIGEVWFASGQSNMVMTMRGFKNCPTEGYYDELMDTPVADRVRMFYVNAVQSDIPLDDVSSKWYNADSDHIGDMGAVAYFFAKRLALKLDVPVGVICSAFGGSSIDSWLPEGVLDDPYPWFKPAKKYNAMINPFLGYAIKGFIWYQGCSNVSDYGIYLSTFSKVVEVWRERWGDADASLPFYSVEIAPYVYEKKSAGKAAMLRQAQHDAVKAVPNSACVGTNDLVYDYEKYQIHPCRKREIGDRLAALALNRDYGFKSIPCYSPEITGEFSIDKENLCLGVANCGNGISRSNDITGLEMCGEDGVFFPVTDVVMTVHEKLLKIQLPYKGFTPAEIRYAWGDFKPGNLKSTDGLPFTPFRLKLY